MLYSPPRISRRPAFRPGWRKPDGLLPPTGYALALDLTNPQLLADGSGNRLTSGSAGVQIADIYDIDGVIRASQATAGLRGTWGGLAGGLVTTANGWYALASLLSLPGDFTAIVSLQRTSGSFVVAGSELTAGALYSPFLALMDSSRSYWAGNVKVGNFLNNSTAKQVQSWRLSAGVRSANVNGVSQSVTANGDGGGSGLYYLLRRGTDFFSGTGNCLGRLLVYTRALTAAELRQAEMWTAQPYSIPIP